MFFKIVVDGVLTKVNVSFYPSGATKVVLELLDDGAQRFILSEDKPYDKLFDYRYFVPHAIMSNFKIDGISITNGLAFIDYTKVKVDSPAKFIEGLIVKHRLTKADLQKGIKTSHMTVYRILNESEGDRLTANLAVRLGKFFGMKPEIFLNVQSNFELLNTIVDLTQDKNVLGDVKYVGVQE